MKLKKIVSWLSGSLVFATGGLLLWGENRRPLRRSVESSFIRNARNLSIAALGAVTIMAMEKPISDRLANLVERRHMGLVKRYKLPIFIEVLLALALLDYTLFIWHVLTHQVPFLWRFHQIG